MLFFSKKQNKWSSFSNKKKETVMKKPFCFIAKRPFFQKMICFENKSLRALFDNSQTENSVHFILKNLKSFQFIAKTQVENSTLTYPNVFFSEMDNSLLVYKKTDHMFFYSPFLFKNQTKNSKNQWFYWFSQINLKYPFSLHSNNKYEIKKMFVSYLNRNSIFVKRDSRKDISKNEIKNRPILLEGKDEQLSGKYSKIHELKLVTISIASPEKIKEWAEKILPNGKIFGEVSNPNTLHYKTFKPHKGGLFCERIFGPLKDFECACGISSKPTEQEFIRRNFCPNCDVEYTWSIIRRYQLGYIQLISPVSHLWYLKANPSYLSLLLDFKKSFLESIIYCTESITLENIFQKSDPQRFDTNNPKNIYSIWQKFIQDEKKVPKKGFIDISYYTKNNIRLNFFKIFSLLRSKNFLLNQKTLFNPFKYRFFYCYYFQNNSLFFLNSKYSKQVKSQENFESNFSIQRISLQRNKVPLSPLELLSKEQSSFESMSFYENYFLISKWRKLKKIGIGLNNFFFFKKWMKITYCKITYSDIFQLKRRFLKSQKTSLLEAKNSSGFQSSQIEETIPNLSFLRLFLISLFSRFHPTFSPYHKMFFFNKVPVISLDMKKTQKFFSFENYLMKSLSKIFLNKSFFNKNFKLYSYFLSSKMKPIFSNKTSFFYLVGFQLVNKIKKIHSLLASFNCSIHLSQTFLHYKKFFDLNDRKKPIFFFQNTNRVGKKEDSSPFSNLLMNKYNSESFFYSIVSISQSSSNSILPKSFEPSFNFDYFNKKLYRKNSQTNKIVLSNEQSSFQSKEFSYMKKSLKNQKKKLVLQKQKEFQLLFLPSSNFLQSNRSTSKDFFIRTNKVFSNELRSFESKEVGIEGVRTKIDPFLPKSFFQIWKIGKIKKSFFSNKKRISFLYTISSFYSWSVASNSVRRNWNSFIYYNSEPINKMNKMIEYYRERNTDKKKFETLTGASLVQLFLKEFHFSELKKMVKQHQILIPIINKSIRKLKKCRFQKSFTNKIQKLFQKKNSIIKRLKFLSKIFHKKTNPNSMILSLLPVLPPDLRPILKLQNQIAASDLNRFYQRILYRNERLKKFLKDPSTSQSFEMKYAQRLLQESVDNLIENGKGGKPETNSRGQPFKSLSEILKGKQGRFRQYLLGKRVDYSGRSVIVVGPKLKLSECGLPFKIAIELFLPFLIKKILDYKLAKTVIGAKNFLYSNQKLTWNLLNQIMKNHPILLNRAPTLHRLGIQAFLPKLIHGQAILLHPLVCPAFNADFDGDQMAVHVPITVEARTEAWSFLFSRNHLLSTATGEPILLPSQDMVLGCYYLTSENLSKNSSKESHKRVSNNSIPTKFEEQKSNQMIQQKNRNNSPEIYSKIFYDWNDIFTAYQTNQVSFQSTIWLRWMGVTEFSNESFTPIEIQIHKFGHSQIIKPKFYSYLNSKGTILSQYIRTTPGRVLMNSIIKDCIY